SAWERVLRAPLDVLALLYRAGARVHRTLYVRGIRRRERLGCRVVSVGNLGVGGAGKTPVTAWLAAGLRRRGHRVAVASRGYGRAARGRDVEVVSDGHRVLCGVDRAGDEPLWLAARAPGVPVLVGPRRDAAGRRAIAAFGTQVLLLDDGFQHHRLARDVDVVVFDGRVGLGNGRLLPRGPLREPPAALARAQAIGVIDGPLPAEDEARVAAAAPRAFRFAVRRVPRGLRAPGGRDLEAVSELRDREVGLLCGIARPASLRASVEALGARVVAERSFPDHHRFRRRDLRGLAEEAPLWITTEKDAVKIHPAWAGEARLRVLVLRHEVEEGEALLDWLERRLRPRARGRDARLPAVRPGPPPDAPPAPGGAAPAAQASARSPRSG
ncbi:MAG: tetraacyldisaccharide 4'-kinase, partial [Myxococcota bacterium]|nr:tetraacyldisaccharide 4'-kinase [Myxococcota bacterium]